MMEDIFSVVAKFSKGPELKTLRRISREVRRGVDRSMPRERLAIEQRNPLGALLSGHAWKEIYDCTLGKHVDYDYADKDTMFDYAFIYGNYDMMSATYRRDDPSSMEFSGPTEEKIVNDLLDRMLRTNPKAILPIIGRGGEKKWTLASHDINLILFDYVENCKYLNTKVHLSSMFCSKIVKYPTNYVIERIKNKKLLHSVIYESLRGLALGMVTGDDTIVFNWCLCYFKLQQYRVITKWDELSRLLSEDSDEDDDTGYDIVRDGFERLRKVDMSHPINPNEPSVI